VAVQGVLLADGWSPPAPVEVEEDTDTWAGETAAPYHPYSARRHIDSLTSSDVISSFVTIFTDPDEEDLLVIDRVRKLLDHLPVIEADFIDLYFFRHVRQTDIATIFGVSQPTVCYRLQRAIQRIKYLLEIPKLDPVDIRTNLRGFFSDPMDVEVMVLMYETTCQSETAKRLGVTQGFVRHRFMRSTRQLCGHPTMKFYGNVFTAVGENLNLLREVQRSSPAIRSGFVLDS
jgi:DNA-directed RNA polymerase specialized sigma24 family protein